MGLNPQKKRSFILVYKRMGIIKPIIVEKSTFTSFIIHSYSFIC